MHEPKEGHQKCLTLIALSVSPAEVIEESWKLEATPGIEPGCADLQSAASPLRHVAPSGAELYHVAFASGNAADPGEVAAVWLWCRARNSNRKHPSRIRDRRFPA